MALKKGTTGYLFWIIFERAWMSEAAVEMFGLVAEDGIKWME